MKISLRCWSGAIVGGLFFFAMLPPPLLGADSLDDSTSTPSASARAVKTCGTAADATIDDRIADCARPLEQGGFGEKATRKFEAPPAPGSDPLDEDDTPTVYEWKLVTRNSARMQVWMDATSGLLWSDLSVDTMAQIFAYDYCRNPRYSGLITGELPMEFSLPEARDFEVAGVHGIFAVLPHLGDLRYWSATLLNMDLAWVFDSYFHAMDTQARWTRLPVRCVSPKDSARK